MMPALLSGLARPPAQVIHIGAGAGTDLPAYLAAGARSVVLIDADPEAVARLEALAASHPGVTAIEAAVSTDPQPRRFRRANFPELSSFRAATGLKELFPGLAILSQETLTPVNPVRLIEPLGLSGEAGNLLVIEAPGEARGILQELQTAGLLTQFDAIRVQEGCEQLYDAAPTIGEIRDFLAAAGFTVEIEPVPEDPDRPHLLARLDRVALEREARIAGLEAELAQTRRQAAAQAESLSSERDAVAAQVGEARALLDAAQAQASEAEQRAEALSGERDAARQEGARLGRELEQAQAQAESLSSERDAAAAQAETAGTALAEARKALAARTTERDAAQAQAQEAGKRAESLSSERDAARQEGARLGKGLEQARQKLEETRTDLKAAQQNLAMALRMQSLREADLKDLQDRYGGLLTRKEAQDALLKRLAASLGNAADHLARAGEPPVAKIAAEPVVEPGGEPVAEPAARRKAGPARKSGKKSGKRSARSSGKSRAASRSDG